MKRKCKQVDITDLGFIENAINDCMTKKNKSVVEKRTDIKRIFDKYGDVHNVAIQLKKELECKNLELKPIRYKKVFDYGSNKVREIALQDIKNQFYDYIAVNGLKDLENTLGKYQCASIKNRGQEYCARAIYGHIQDRNVKYAIKLDIRKYYESIDRNKLMNWLKKRIKNDMLLWLIEQLLYTFKNGLSLGSYLSQFLGNLYLSDIYHNVESMHYKRRNKLIKSVSFVCFYMDDILIVGSNSRKLINVAKQIEIYCLDKGLQIKPNWSCININDGFIDMAGYRIFKTHITIRRATFKKIRRAYLRADRKPHDIVYARRVISYQGKLKYSKSSKFCSKYNVYKVFKKAKGVLSKYDKINNKIRCQTT